MYADLPAMMAAVTREVFTPRARPPVDLWCDEHRTIATSKGSAATRRWSTDEVPYLREPLRRYTDPEVRETTLQKSTQVGATEALFCVVAYEAAVNQRSLLYVYPTEKKGREVNKDRLVPALKGCEPLARAISRLGKRAVVDHKIRLGTSMVQFGYTQSRDSLRGDPFPGVLNDELDTFDFTGEDPIENGRSRQTTFDDAFTWHVSTPMSDSSGITDLYERSQVRWTYRTPCPRCGGYFELWDWGLVEWLGGMDADPLVAAANCWLRCPCCDERIGLDAHRWMVQHGIWITQGESIESDGTVIESLDDHGQLAEGWPMGSRLTGDAFRADEDGAYGEHAERFGVRIVGQRDRGPKHGYRVCILQSLVAAEGIRGVVREFLEHDGRPGPTWWRDRLGRSPSTRGERVEITDLELLCHDPDEGGYHFGECPEWTVGVYGGVDVQKRCYKLLLKAYGPEGRRRAMVWAAELPRDETLRMEDLKRYLLDIAPLPVKNHTRRMVPHWLIDSGYETLDVYHAVHDLQRQTSRDRYIACKGMSTPETKDHFYTTRRLREMTTPDGKRVMLPFNIELVMVNGHMYRDQRAPRLVPMDPATLERLAAQFPATAEGRAELAALLERIEPVRFPGIGSWRELAPRVFAEIAEDEKVLIGRGSGRSGPDGTGRPRQVWRKRVAHRPNDWGDCDVYADACAERHGIVRFTEDKAREVIERLEQDSRTAGAAPRPAVRTKPGRSSPPTIAGDAAGNPIF